MRYAVLAILVASCGGGRPAPVAPTTGGIDWASVIDQSAAMAAWRELAPTGLTEEQVLAEIPPEARRPMAFALIRDGDFSCAHARDQCDGSDDEPGVADTLASPCLREDLVYALLADAVIAAPDDVKAAVAASGVVDLVHDVAYEMPDDEQLAYLAAAGAAGDQAVSDLLIDDARDKIARAVRDFHLDGAVELLDPSERDLFIGALADDAIGEPGKRDAISVLWHYEPQALAGDDRLVDALIEITATSECELAASAAEMLAALGRPEYLPARPHTTDPAVMTRALCLLAWADRGPRDEALLATFVGEQGLTFEQPPDPPVHYTAGDPKLRELFDYLPDEGDATMAYDFAPAADGELRLTRIHRRVQMTVVETC